MIKRELKRASRGVQPAAMLCGSAMLASLLNCPPAAADLRDSEASATVALAPVIRSFFVTESIFPQEPGEFEFRVASAFARQRHSAGWDAPMSIELEYAMTQRLQVSAGIPWQMSRDVAGDHHDGLGPVSLGLQFNVIAPERGPALSFALEITTPVDSASQRDGDQATEGEFLMILARSYDEFQIHLNLGGELEEGGNAAVLLGAGVLLDVGQFIPTIELRGSSSTEENTFDVVPGLHWHFNATTELSIGASAELAGSRRIALLSAITVEF